MTTTIDLTGNEHADTIPIDQVAYHEETLWGFSSPRKTDAIKTGYSFSTLSLLDTQDVLLLQEQVMTNLKSRSWLRTNTVESIQTCLEKHISLGVRFEGSLVAAAVLYDGGNTSESIRGYFTDDLTMLNSSVNLKLVLASPAHRGVGLGRTLVELLHHQAILMGKEDIACTIHPQNLPSQMLFSRLGYQQIGNANTPYGVRNVFAKNLR